MMKRIIALLLALILTVGLLPTVALATEGETPAAGTSSDVKNGYYEGTTWKEGTLNQGTLPTGVVSVSKTAEKVEGKDNEYEVTLQVVLQQTEENSGKAATVLVLDTSVSMAYCAECGVKGDCVHNYVKFNGTPNSNDQYYYKTTDKNGKEKFERAYYCDGNHTNNKHNAGWFKSNKDRKHTAQNRLRDDNIYFKTTRASRLDAAKVAAENFLKTYSGLTFNTDGMPAANQNSRNLGRYVSVVSFAEKAKSVQSWVDVSNSDVYQKVLKNIKGLSAEGGTNLDAGLTYAEYLLNDKDVNGAVKNVIALTDGQPTYCLKKNCNDPWHLLRTKLTIGSTKYCVHGDGTECTDEIYNSTVDTATRVKNVPSKLYTVCFDAGETIDVPNNGGQISVSEYLRTKIATQPKAGEKFAYDASNAEQLYAEFAKITQSIVSGLNTGTVKDTLPTGITSEAFGKDKVKEWKLNEAPFTKNETPNTVGEKQVTTYTYTYTYTVTIDPKTVKTEKVDGVDYAPLNGETTLTVGSGADAKEIPFPIPAGKVTMPSYTVTWKSQDGNNTLETDSNVEYNTKPSFDRADPTKPDDAQYTYTFVGWATEANKETGTLEADLPPVTDDVTYYAAFSKTARTYTVTWMPQDGQGNAYETDTGVAYNASPSYDSEVPTKAADDKYTYTFAGWATTTNQTSGSTVDALPNVTENVTYYAAFSATPRTYTVTFKDGANGEVFVDETQQVEYGKNIPSHDNPVRPGYNFIGWTSEPANYQPGTGTMPANNITFTAQWTEKGSVTINYVAKTGGSVTLASETLNPDTGTAAGSTATAGTGYTFDGWYDNEECTGNALSTSAEYKPTKPTTGWVNGTTFYAKFTKNTATLELNGLFKKQLNSDVSLDDVPADGKTFELTITRGDFTATGTATVTSLDEAAAFNFSTSRVLTFDAPDTYTYTVKETNSGVSGMKYAENGILTVEVGQNMTITSATIKMHANTDPVSISANEPCTITNTYTQPTETFNLNTLIKKHFTKAAESAEIPNENFTFTATIESYPDKEHTYIGTVTMNGTENDKYFDFGGSQNLTLTPGTYQYRVTEEPGTDTRIRYDSSAYILTIRVENDGSYNVSVEPEAPAAQSLTTAAAVFPDNKQITFTNTYFEKKDPSKLYIDFSDFVQKELTATGTKTASDVDFTVNVNGKEQVIIITSAGSEEEIGTDAEEFDPKYSRTLTAHFDSITGGEVKTTRFTGTTVEIDHAGYYTFFLGEEKGTRTGVTYDEARYTLYINVRLDQNENKLYVSSMGAIRTNADGTWENIALIEIVNDKPVRTTNYITFHNTIDTGKDDYYPIIIPTIINKDTGMLNKTDHFAYVIGYPDGTVHPNGQITRAEVATIFFRLLRDEVRDGAFTTSNSYSDVAYGKWYNNPISTMSALGIITGYPDGTFKPNKPITRAEFAAIAARFDETQSGKSATFSDVIGHWAAREIGIAYYNDWIKGYPDGTFKPDQNITRAEAMTLINRVLERKPESPADLLTNMNKWTDNMDTSKWYYLDVQEATNSHGYTRKTFNYELWRQMLPDPDWSRYER